jgi:hypothetical protein
LVLVTWFILTPIPESKTKHSTPAENHIHWQHKLILERAREVNITAIYLLPGQSVWVKQRQAQDPLKAIKLKLDILVVATELLFSIGLRLIKKLKYK